MTQNEANHIVWPILRCKVNDSACFYLTLLRFFCCALLHKYAFQQTTAISAQFGELCDSLFQLFRFLRCVVPPYWMSFKKKCFFSCFYYKLNNKRESRATTKNQQQHRKYKSSHQLKRHNKFSNGNVYGLCMVCVYISERRAREEKKNHAANVSSAPASASLSMYIPISHVLRNDERKHKGDSL